MKNGFLTSKSLYSQEKIVYCFCLKLEKPYFWHYKEYKILYLYYEQINLCYFISIGRGSIYVMPSFLRIGSTCSKNILLLTVFSGAVHMFF
jgi:hypothetical protein